MCSADLFDNMATDRADSLGFPLNSSQPDLTHTPMDTSIPTSAPQESPVSTSDISMDCCHSHFNPTSLDARLFR